MDQISYMVYGAAAVILGLAVRTEIQRIRFARELAARYAQHVAAQAAADQPVPVVDATAQQVADRLEDERIAAFERRRGLS